MPLCLHKKNNALLLTVADHFKKPTKKTEPERKRNRELPGGLNVLACWGVGRIS